MLTPFSPQYFKDFLEQEIEKYEDRRNAEENYDEENAEKPFREVSRPSVIKIDQQFYFMSGKDQIFFLDTAENAPKLTRKLDLEDISALPVDLLYTGKYEEFSDDEVPAFAELATIIYNMNLMQEEKVILDNENNVWNNLFSFGVSRLLRCSSSAWVSSTLTSWMSKATTWHL